MVGLFFPFLLICRFGLLTLGVKTTECNRGGNILLDALTSAFFDGTDIKNGSQHYPSFELPWSQADISNQSKMTLKIEHTRQTQTQSQSAQDSLSPALLPGVQFRQFSYDIL